MGGTGDLSKRVTDTTLHARLLDDNDARRAGRSLKLTTLLMGRSQPRGWRLLAVAVWPRRLRRSVAQTSAWGWPLVVSGDSVGKSVQSPTGHENMANLECPKCRGAMEPGFLVDHTYSTVTAAEWAEGPVERSFWTGVKLRGRERRSIETHRCTRCGYLEMYAR